MLVETCRMHTPVTTFKTSDKRVKRDTVIIDSVLSVFYETILCSYLIDAATVNYRVDSKRF
jgi:hypothetical protein